MSNPEVVASIAGNVCGDNDSNNYCSGYMFNARFYRSPMKIDCYMSLKCGSEDALRENILKALVLENITAEVNFYRITEEQAKSMGLRGSPSVLINGQDIQPAPIEGFS